jgi:hypothetical protein
VSAEDVEVVIDLDYMEHPLTLNFGDTNTRPLEPASSFDVIEDSGARIHLQALAEEQVRSVLQDQMPKQLLALSTEAEVQLKQQTRFDFKQWQVEAACFNLAYVGSGCDGKGLHDVLSIAFR